MRAIKVLRCDSCTGETKSRLFPKNLAILSPEPTRNFRDQVFTITIGTLRAISETYDRARLHFDEAPLLETERVALRVCVGIRG